MFRKKSAFVEKLDTQEKYVKEAIRDRSNGVFSSLKKAAEFHGVKLGTVQKRYKKVSKDVVHVSPFIRKITN